VHRSVRLRGAHVLYFVLNSAPASQESDANRSEQRERKRGRFRDGNGQSVGAAALTASVSVFRSAPFHSVMFNGRSAIVRIEESQTGRVNVYVRFRREEKGF
jgi:hypothetical protein